jgi:hypothetical protein
MKREKLIMVSLLFYYATETRNSYIIIFRENPRFRGKKFKMIHCLEVSLILYSPFFIAHFSFLIQKKGSWKGAL